MTKVTVVPAVVISGQPHSQLGAQASSHRASGVAMGRLAPNARERKRGPCQVHGACDVSLVSPELKAVAPRLTEERASNIGRRGRSERADLA